MRRDFSVVPANKKITNTTNIGIKFDLRDKCKQVAVELQPNDVVEVTVETSEGLALLNKKCAELGLNLEDVVTEDAETDENA